MTLTARWWHWLQRTVFDDMDAAQVASMGRNVGRCLAFRLWVRGMMGIYNLHVHRQVRSRVRDCKHNSSRTAS